MIVVMFSARKINIEHKFIMDILYISEVTNNREGQMKQNQ